MKENEAQHSVPSVRVFGSAIVRVAPDSASILLAVSRVEERPEEAFAQAREAAQTVNAALHKAGVKTYGTSRITLSQEVRYGNAEKRFAGYQARLGFNVVAHELDKLDELLSALIRAGANELTSVIFQTLKLKEFRADVRRKAIAVAREKAELYCSAAGVAVGPVLSIEDVDPDFLTNRGGGHVSRDSTPDDEGEPGPIDPGAILVGAAVNVVYQIEARG